MVIALIPGNMPLRFVALSPTRPAHDGLAIFGQEHKENRMKARANMILAGVALAAMSGAASAHDRIGIHLSIGMPAPYVSSAPIYVAPAPRVIVRRYSGPQYYASPADSYVVPPAFPPLISIYPAAPVVVYEPQRVNRHRDWRREWRHERHRGQWHGDR